MLCHAWIRAFAVPECHDLLAGEMGIHTIRFTIHMTIPWRGFLHMAFQNPAQTLFSAAQRNPDVVHGQPQPLPDFPIRQLLEKCFRRISSRSLGESLPTAALTSSRADSGIGITLFKVTGAMSFTDRQATVEQFVR